MGQPIAVTEKPSSYPGVVRFETNRALTGMGHERYVAGTEVWGERPPDELARRLLAKPSVDGVQINSNVVTVDLVKGYDAGGLRQIIEDLYIFYPDAPAGTAAGADTGDEPVDDATVAPVAPSAPAAESDDVTPDAQVDAAPEALAEPADAIDPETAEAPAPVRDNAEPTAANPAAAAPPDGPAPAVGSAADPEPPTAASPEADEPEPETEAPVHAEEPAEGSDGEGNRPIEVPVHAEEPAEGVDAG